MRNRIGMKTLAIAMLTVLLLPLFGFAEGMIEESELYLEYEDGMVSELGEIDLMSPEIHDDEVTEEPWQGDGLEVGAPSASEDVVVEDDGEQAVLATAGTCRHEDTFLVNGNETRISCKKSGKYQHVSIYSMTGTVTLECKVCDAVLRQNTISSPVYMQRRELCSFNIVKKHKKCSVCKQKKTSCKHKRYHEVSKIYGKDDLATMTNSSYFDANTHITVVYEPINAWGQRVQMYICDTCGAFATKNTDIESGEAVFSWWNREKIALEIDCSERYEVQAHNYVNGICTGCGHIKVPGSVMLAATETRLPVKGKFDLSPTVSPAGSMTDITYSTSNKKIATVNASGKVTAKKAGTATITASVMGIPMATCKVTVYKNPSKVSLNKKKQP